MKCGKYVQINISLSSVEYYFCNLSKAFYISQELSIYAKKQHQQFNYTINEAWPSISGYTKKSPKNTKEN